MSGLPDGLDEPGVADVLIASDDGNVFPENFPPQNGGAANNGVVDVQSRRHVLNHRFIGRVHRAAIVSGECPSDVGPGYLDPSAVGEETQFGKGDSG